MAATPEQLCGLSDLMWSLIQFHEERSSHSDYKRRAIPACQPFTVRPNLPILIANWLQAFTESTRASFALRLRSCPCAVHRRRNDYRHYHNRGLRRRKHETPHDRFLTKTASEKQQFFDERRQTAGAEGRQAAPKTTANPPGLLVRRFASGNQALPRPVGRSSRRGV